MIKTAAQLASFVPEAASSARDFEQKYKDGLGLLGCGPNQDIIDIHVIWRSEAPHHCRSNVLRLQALHGAVSALGCSFVAKC